MKQYYDANLKDFPESKDALKRLEDAEACLPEAQYDSDDEILGVQMKVITFHPPITPRVARYVF
jgi:hypothetical protein